LASSDEPVAASVPEMGAPIRLPEAALRLLETAPEAMVIADERGRIVLVNPAAERLLGYARDELVGQALNRVVPRLIGVRRDGSAFPAELSISPLETESGLLSMAAIREILEGEVTAEHPALPPARAVEAQDEFLTIAAHELRTPLTALQLQLDALGSSLNAVDPEVREKYARVHARAESAARNASRLADLLNTLLDLTRIVGGRLHLKLEEINVAAVVREAITEFTDTEHPPSDVVLDAPDHLPAVCDRWRFEQIVTNMLSNACKYGQGQPIEVRLAGSDAAIELTVRDHGIGVAPEDRERIFEKFQRATAARQYGGMGLGLYVSRRLAEAHGGTIAVAPTVGPGATFVLRLPHHLPDRPAARL
jgi:two-component system sensor kinase FixL